MSVLVIDSVEKTYDGGLRPVAALRGVSFEAAAGDFIALMGPSGCGKSTLLHLVGGMDFPSRGRVWLDGVALNELGEEALARVRRTSIGFVFQFFNLLPTLTVVENVSLPMLLDGVSETQSRGRANEVLDHVGLAARAKHFPAQLSGGELQRAAVARAVVTKPRLVLADEPTGNLDTDSGSQVMKLLADLNRDSGVTVLLATHSEEAAGYASRMIRMRDGLIHDDSRK
ncbi:MAG: ABC transporter ATP-binding protein [Blastocatellia bacterium]